MLSLLVVLFCGFISINGALEICEESKSEDVDCLTPCEKYVSCSKYGRDDGRDNDEVRQHERDCKKKLGGDPTIWLCESIVKSKVGTNDPNLCLTFEEWVDKMWEASTRAERNDEAFTRDIPDFDDYWSNKCQVKRRTEGELDSVHCVNYQKRHQIDPFHVTKDMMLRGARGRTFSRAHLILDSGELSYYCFVAPPSGKAAYKERLLTAFSQKARAAKEFARSETATAAAGGGRTRHGYAGTGLPPPHVPQRPPPRAGIAPPLPPPRAGIAPPLPRARRAARERAERERGPAEEAMGSSEARRAGKRRAAHEEYADNLWNEVNQMEEDELRYERALDKLRRATQLRELQKKRLREYYN